MFKYFSTNQFKNVIKSVHDRANLLRIEVPTLTFLGTVKLHGTNSSVYSCLKDDSFVTQSKNNIITPKDDNNGFSAFLHKNENQTVIKNIFNNIKQEFPQLVETKTAVLYGEWCGGNIQKVVALKDLEKMFVVFAVKLSDNEQKENVPEIWLNGEQIKKIIGKPQNNIYNIYDFQTWTVDIDMRAPKNIQNKLIDITNGVEQECPVASQLGVKGLGEGVVWKCISTHPMIQTDDLVFKVKGKEHSVTHVKTIAEVDEEKVNSINEFVSKVVTPNRLQQGLDYLKEQHLELDVRNMGVFLKWMSDDCVREEGEMMAQSGFDKKEVTPVISQACKRWFFEKIKKEVSNIGEKSSVNKSKPSM